MEKILGRNRTKKKNLFKDAPVGPLLFYLLISTLFIMALATIILTIVFLPISSKGSVSANLDSLAFGITPEVSNFKEIQLVGQSEELKLIAQGVFQFNCSSISVVREDPTTGERIEDQFYDNLFSLSTERVDGFTYFFCPNNSGSIKFTLSEYLSPYFLYSFSKHSSGFNNFSNPKLRFTTLKSECSVISLSGEYNAENDEASTLSGSFAVKGGTRVTFDTPAIITIPDKGHTSMDPDRLPDASYEVLEIVFNDDSEGDVILVAGDYWDENEAYLDRYEEKKIWYEYPNEQHISFILLGDTLDYSLTVVNAESISVIGSGSFTYSKNSSNDMSEIHSQSIEVEKGECNLFYTKQDGSESLRFEGIVKKLLVSSKSRHLSFFNWLHNNIGIVPTALLTILGGAITISLKLIDKYTEKEEINPNEEAAISQNNEITGTEDCKQDSNPTKALDEEELPATDEQE